MEARPYGEKCTDFHLHDKRTECALSAQTLTVAAALKKKIVGLSGVPKLTLFL